MSNPPKTIYLQHCDDESCKGECISRCIMSDATWCSDQINDNDLEYELVEVKKP